MRTFASYVYYPASLLLAFYAGWWLVALGMPDWTLVAALPLAFLAATFALELAVPLAPGWRFHGADLKTDLLHSVLSNTIPPQLVRIALATALAAAARWLGDGGVLWPSAWPIPAQLGLALILGELAFYIQHRFYHETKYFPFHAIHHSSERMYVLAASRLHPVQVLFSYAMQMLPLWLLGAPQPIIAFYLSFTAVHGIVQHSNLPVRSGFLDFILATPDVHRWHHSRVVKESNSNYSNTILLWDWVFGTRFFPRRPTKLYGDGVGLPRDSELPTRFLTHLRYPFGAIWGREQEPG